MHDSSSRSTFNMTLHNMMFRTVRLLTAKVLAVIFLVTFFLSPALWMLSKEDNWFDSKSMLAWYVVALSVFWAHVLLHHASRNRLFYLCAAIGLLNAIDIGLIVFFGLRLNSAQWLTLFGNMGDATDLLSAFSTLFVFTATLYLLFIYSLHRFMRQPNNLMFNRKGLVYVSVLALMGLYSISLYRAHAPGRMLSNSVREAFSKDMSSPMGGLVQLGVALDIVNQNSHAIESRRAFSHQATQIGEGVDVFLYVIGESSRPQNWSLNGYERNTNPRLMTKNVLFFNRLLTAGPSTSIAVPAMLSLGQIDDFEGIKSSKSIVSALGEAGYQTHWYSTQDADSWGGIIPFVAQEASDLKYLTRQYDSVLVQHLKAILSDFSSGSKKFVVFHTMGSHFDYSKRYPSTQGVFSGGNALVDSYDNSIVFTDRVLSELIDVLQASGLKTIMLYSSDHGENLGEDGSGVLGHGSGTINDLSVASFFWFSESAKLSHRHAHELLAARRSTFAGISDLPHTVLDLVGVKTRQSSKARSLASDDFSVLPQSYLKDGQVHPWPVDRRN